MKSLIGTLEREINSMLQDSKFHLLEIKRSVTKRFIILNIYMDREDGFFTHQDCMEWSGKIQDLIDSRNLVRGDYRLEVSSPGIGRELNERWEFVKNSEKKVQAVYKADDGSLVEVSGIMIQVDDNGILIKNKKGIKEIAWVNLRKVKVVPPW